MVRTHSTPLQKFVLQPNVHHLLRELQREHPKLDPYHGEDKVKETKAQWRSRFASMKYRFGKDNSKSQFDHQNLARELKHVPQTKKEDCGFKFTIDNKILEEFAKEKVDVSTLPGKIESVSPKTRKFSIENYVKIVNTSSKPKDTEIRIPELDSELVARLLKEISLASK